MKLKTEEPPRTPKFPTDYEDLRKAFIKLSDKHDELQKQLFHTNKQVTRLGRQLLKYVPVEDRE